MVGQMHNQLGITKPIGTDIVSYYERPYQVIFAERFAEELIEQIGDSAIRKLAQTHKFGSIDQFSDSTDFREPVGLRQHIKNLYLPFG